MKWVRFRIKTITDMEDVIISTLYDIGLEGAQIEDKIPLTALEKEQMFVDILPDGPEDDGVAYLNFFVEKQEDGSLMGVVDQRAAEESVRAYTPVPGGVGTVTSTVLAAHVAEAARRRLHGK